MHRANFLPGFFTRSSNAGHPAATAAVRRKFPLFGTEYALLSPR